MNKVGQVIKKNTLLIALVLIVGLFAVLTQGSILNPQNINNLISQNAYVIILAVGMLLCILTGGNVDLSVGSIVAMVGSIAGVMMVNNGVSIYVTMALCILLGVLVGAFQGLVIAYIKVPPFIATLAGMMIWRGISLIILDGFTISPFPDTYLNIFNSYIPDFIGNENTLNYTCLLLGVIAVIAYVIGKARYFMAAKKSNGHGQNVSDLIINILIFSAAVLYVTYKLAAYRGVPLILVYLIAIVFIYYYYTTKTVPGRYLYAVGGNEKAAKLSGVDTEKVYFKAYTNMGLLSGLSALVVVARFNAAAPTTGTSYEMDAIASCFLGGASAYGGTGSVFGAVIGAVFMGVLNNGMSIMGIDANWQRVVKGAVLLAAVIFDVISKRKKD